MKHIVTMTLINYTGTSPQPENALGNNTEFDGTIPLDNNSLAASGSLGNSPSEIDSNGRPMDQEDKVLPMDGGNDAAAPGNYSVPVLVSHAASYNTGTLFCMMLAVSGMYILVPYL